MITKSLMRRSMAPGLISSQSRAMGGGEKRPNMPASNMDFDIVAVGKFIFQFSNDF